MKKYRFIKEVRRYLEDNGYIEIETPVLIDHPSGATARPFISHHNALDMDVYLRIAPETYLKCNQGKIVTRYACWHTGCCSIFYSFAYRFVRLSRITPVQFRPKAKS